MDTQHPEEGWGCAGPLTDRNATPDPITVAAPEVKEEKRSGRGSSVAKIRIKATPPLVATGGKKK